LKDLREEKTGLSIEALLMTLINL